MLLDVVNSSGSTAGIHGIYSADGTSSTFRASLLEDMIGENAGTGSSFSDWMKDNCPTFSTVANWKCDFDLDGNVDFDDYLTISNNYGTVRQNLCNWRLQRRWLRQRIRSWLSKAPLRFIDPWYLPSG